MTVLCSNNRGSGGIYRAPKQVGIAVTNRDGTLITQEKEVTAANSHSNATSCEGNSNGTFETIEDFDFTINVDTTRSNELTVRIVDGALPTVIDRVHQCSKGVPEL